jgi:trigger factor
MKGSLALKIETQALENHRVKLTVEFDSSTMDEYKRHAARSLAGRMKIPGFRPGKAPYAVVVRQVGEAALIEEAIDHLINEEYENIIKESEIHPYSAGKVENITSFDPPIFEIVVPLEPVTNLGDYHSIRRDYEAPITGEAQVDEVLDNLRDRQAVLEPADRPALNGDVVSVRMSAERMNPEEGQQTNLVEEGPYTFRIRSDEHPAQDEWPFPGFSAQLIGLSAGEGKSFLHQFDQEAKFEDLRGVEANYHVNVEEVKSRLLPDLDDDFAKSVGDYTDLEALKAEILTGLSDQAQNGYDETYDEAILGELIELSDIQYPPEMVEAEQKTIVDNFKHRLEERGSDLNVYLKARQMDMDGLMEEAKPAAEGQVKRSLVLLALAKAEDLKVEEAELQNATIQTLQQLNQSLKPGDARRLSDERVINNLVGNLMIDMLTHKAQHRLRDIASGNYPPPPEAQSAEPLEPAADEAVQEMQEMVENTPQETAVAETTVDTTNEEQSQ